MNKAVLIGLTPQQCAYFANNNILCVMLKKMPKLEPPYTVYVYCLNMPKYHHLYDLTYLNPDKKRTYAVTQHNKDSLVPGNYLNGKVIGKAKCTKKDINGLFIRGFVSFKKPKELGDFWAYNEELHNEYDENGCFCCYDYDADNMLSNCYDNILNCYKCWEEWSGYCHKVNRITQKLWCYVEGK